MLSPGEGETIWLGGLGVRLMIDGKETGETFALAEHPMEPRILAAPMHTYRHEDEYTFVLEGEVRCPGRGRSPYRPVRGPGLQAPSRSARLLERG